MNGSDGLEGRVTVVEGRVAQLEVDEDETRLLAANADREVSEFKGALKGNTKLIEMLRETQVEQGQKLDLHSRQLDALGRQLDARGRQLDAVERRLEEQGRRLDEHSELIRGLDDRVQGLDSRFEALESEMQRGIATLQDGMTRVVALLEGRSLEEDGAVS